MSGHPVLGVDVGGTFTDAVLARPGAGPVAVKVPTTDPPDAGVLEAARLACNRAGYDPGTIDQLRHGSTVATNALLERTVATTALVTTSGFRDVLEIGRQDRPVTYDLAAERPPALVPRSRRFGIDERTPPPGHPEPERIRRPVDRSELGRLSDDLAEAEAVAVCLLHSDVDPRHERTVADRLDDALEAPVVASVDVDATVREFERMATTVASAALTPVLATYLDRLVDGAVEMGLPPPMIMQSNGGIADAEQVTARAATAVLSGPAAGVVGAAQAVDGEGTADRISLDMGGTSADVCVIEGGAPATTTETVVGGIPIRVPSVDIHTVGAGGGSVAWVDAGGALRVGPDSAGADPGPSCYGRGGTEPTVTDAALVLGVLDADRSIGGGLALERDPAVAAMDRLADEAGLGDTAAAAAGVYRVATEAMTQATRHVTVERGRDPRGMRLVAFGGAGGMFAAAIAERLGIERVAIPHHAGLLSAVGLVTADERHDVATGFHQPITATDAMEDSFERLESTALERCSDPTRATLERSLDLRYAGQSYELTVPVDAPVDAAAIAERFQTVHRRRRGYVLDDRIDAITCRVEAVRPSAGMTRTEPAADFAAGDGRRVAVPPWATAEYAVYTDGVPPDAETPCIVERPNDTLVVPPGWSIVATAPTVVIAREEGP